MDLKEAIYFTAALLSILVSVLALWEFAVRRAPVPASASASLTVPSWRFLFRAALVVAVLLVVAFLALLAYGMLSLASSWLPRLTGGAPSEVTNSIGMRLVRIRPGKFTMGSPPDEPGRLDNEAQHEVEITRAFYLGVYEVTQGEYRQVTGKNPSQHTAGGGCEHAVRGMDTRRFPVEQLSWRDASEFCRLLSEMPAEKKAGRTYRLPTEAEWEYACRAGTTTATYAGSSFSSSDGNIHGEQPYGGAPRGTHLGRPVPGGSYKPNAWGLYDMQGNVVEWCQEWYDPTYYRHSPAKDPPGPQANVFENRRVARGTAYDSGGPGIRSAQRGGAPIDYTAAHMGFRAAMDVVR